MTPSPLFSTVDLRNKEVLQSILQTAKILKNSEVMHEASMWLNMPLNRTEALSKGQMYFLPEQPCRRGHTTPRYASTGNCIECLRFIRKAGEGQLLDTSSYPYQAIYGLENSAKSVRELTQAVELSDGNKTGFLLRRVRSFLERLPPEPPHNHVLLRAAELLIAAKHHRSEGMLADAVDIAQEGIQLAHSHRAATIKAFNGRTVTMEDELRERAERARGYSSSDDFKPQLIKP